MKTKRTIKRSEHESKQKSINGKLLNKQRSTYDSEAVVQRCSVKKVFLEISQNS